MRVLARPVLVKDLTWLMLAVFAALGIRLVQIQQQRRDQLLAMTARQRYAAIPIPARRGLIADAMGRTMALSVDRPSVFADPKLIVGTDGPEICQHVAEELSRVFDLNPEVLISDLTHRADRRFYWVKRRVTEEQAEAVRKLNLQGVGILHEPERQYPMNERFAHGIGFVNREGEALAGLELRFDDRLKGQAGRRTVVTDVRRRPIFTHQEDYRPPRDGSHLVLTIDAVIQAIAEQELVAVVRKHRAKAGCAIIMAPQTGDVLALANVPTFDVNEFSHYPASARCNLAIQAPVEPGSTFKPFIATAALAEKVTWPGQKIFCHRGLYVAGRRRLHDHHPYDTLTFEQVVIKSSNIGMAILGQRLGNSRMHRYVSAFGFGRRTGIELPGEDSGIVHPLRRWTSYSTTSLPMGQEISVTPMQLTAAFSAIVNDGVLLRPKVVRYVLRSDGAMEEDRSKPVEVGRVLPKKVARKFARDILVDVVRKGTGTRAALAEYQVLGKTGTAQIARRDGRGYEPDAYVSSFVGSAPAKDPQILVYLAVVRPDPRINYYGGRVAAPAVREILAKTLAYMGVAPTLDPSKSVQVVRR
jgi:cell division protein FtsI (penicillin-binding protein 3)